MTTTMRAAFLLAVVSTVLPGGFTPPAGAADSSSASASDATWTAIPLPDGTLVYVRYGEPGGVRIQSGTRAVEDTNHVASEPPRTDQATTDRPAQDPEAKLRRILREELALVPTLSTTPVVIERLVPVPIEGPPPPKEDRVQIVDPAEPPDTRPVPGTPPAEPVPVPVPVPVVPTPPEPRGDVETHVRVIRQAFLSDGLVRTNLVLFETDSDRLLPYSDAFLNAVVGVLVEFPEARITVEGHTDSRGSAAHNTDLSRRRAASVRDRLLELGNGAVAATRVTSTGFGEDRPLVEGNSPTALALNRRVEFRIQNPDALQNER